MNANNKTFVLPCQLKIENPTQAVHFLFKPSSVHLVLTEQSNIKHAKVRDKYQLSRRLRGIRGFEYSVESFATETPVPLAVFKSHFEIQAISTPVHKHRLFHYT